MVNLRQAGEVVGRRERRSATSPGGGALLPYLLSGPAVLLIGVVFVFPVIFGVYRSAYGSHLLERVDTYVGLGNYVEVLSDPAFWLAFQRTGVFVLGVVGVGTALALVFSFALLRQTGGVRFLRAVSLLPYVVSSVAAAVMFRFLFNQQSGLLNRFLELIGLPAQAWLAQPDLAMVTVVTAQVWTDLPLSLLIVLGGLRTLDHSRLEAALVDGATAWQRARYVIIPHIAPQILLSTIFLSYGAVTAFGMVLTLTNGGPGEATEILGVHLYNTAFRDLDRGQGFAIMVLILLLNMLLTLLYAWMARRRTSEQD